MNANLLLRISAVALLATLAGCGNKGPLVHPATPADSMPAPATNAPSPASTAAAMPTDATAPVPASTAPVTPTDTTTPPPPANGGG